MEHWGANYMKQTPGNPHWPSISRVLAIIAKLLERTLHVFKMFRATVMLQKGQIGAENLTHFWPTRSEVPLPGACDPFSERLYFSCTQPANCCSAVSGSLKTYLKLPSFNVT